MAKANAKKPAMNADELKKTVAAFEKRRKARLDGEDEPSAIPEKIIIEGVVKPQEGATDDDTNPVASEGGPKEMTLAEKVQEIRDRRDRRDADGDPEDVEGAKGVIAQQDEDISCLLELVEKLEAAKDFGGDSSDENKDEGDENKDEGEPGEKKDEDKSMNADSVDRIISTRLELARVGDKLNLDGLEKLKPIEAKKKIIAAINPGVRLDGKSSVYIDAAFEYAMNDLNSRKDTNYQRKQMFNADGKNTPSMTSGASEARKRMEEKILYGGNE